MKKEEERAVVCSRPEGPLELAAVEEEEEEERKERTPRDAVVVCGCVL